MFLNDRAIDVCKYNDKRKEDETGRAILKTSSFLTL